MTTKKPIVDGGYAWVVLAALVLIDLLVGMMWTCVGILTTAIVEEIEDDITKASLVGSTFFGTATLMGPISGLLQDRIGHRWTGVTSGILLLVGFASASFCKTITGLICTFGFIAGVGASLAMNITGVAPGSYFVKKLSMAYGLLQVGGGCGVFMIGPITVLLLDKYHLSGTLLILGGIMFHVSLAGALIRPNTVIQDEEIVIKPTEDPCSQVDDIGVQPSSGPAAILVEDGCLDDVVTEEEPFVASTCPDGSRPETRKLVDSERQATVRTEKEGFANLDCVEDPETGQKLVDPNFQDSSVNGKILFVYSKYHDVAIVEREQIVHPENIEDEKERLLYDESPGTNTDHEDILSVSLPENQNVDTINLCKGEKEAVKSESVVELDFVLKCDNLETESDLSLNSASKSTGNEQTHTSKTRTKSSECRSSDECLNIDISYDVYQEPRVTDCDDICDKMSQLPTHLNTKSLQSSDCTNNRDERAPYPTEHITPKASVDSRLLEHPLTDKERLENKDKSTDRLAIMTSHALKLVQVLRSNGFYVYLLSSIFWTLGDSACLLHLPNYAESKGSTPTQAATVLTGLGVASILSSVLTGFVVSDPAIGNILINFGSLGMSGAITVLFPLYSHSFYLQTLFSTIYGLYAQTPFTLVGPICIQLVGIKNLAFGFGLTSFVTGLGYLAGPPLASLIYENSGVYDSSFIFAGCCLLTSAFLLALVPMFKSRHQEGEMMKEV